MRINDKILLDNIEDYFNHKGLSPHLIDDIKEKVNTDIKNSEKQDQDYIEYKGKSPAQIILMIQRNLFALQLNPVIFFILNFILISYLYDKQYVQFQAITGMSLFYCLIIFPMTIVVCLRVSKKNYLRSNKLEMIMGTVIAIISLFLIVLQAFNVAWGVIPITNFGHQFFFFVGIILVIVGIFYKHLEFSGIGLLFCQKTIDAMIHNPQTAQVFSLIIWILLVILVIYFTIRLSSRTRV
ncbi:hypothetical protein CD116_11905 [Staphylococcus schweitzeri]|uniref:Uncharacterized protein n=1 Tax=Staphylococcus schweitzeri TaxID=1654388 RepID=A0A2K4AF70_9STAP|nr:hypothetical protein [Staphylococcus schweitzeri]MBE2129073.1 hypothetical protein [Staphylococcus schweitzeri]PNZ48444.1 hypothetical protein CD116_11905 [Staphylococcus schweitzeri]CDR26652.1 hypothetical protein ERS140162_02109 [Staphylococcus schweitzeri]CDR54032.1 hypothetical protein ERS140266_01354 [Staphylococcus schweitzeri]CDR60571.1 hypothetical protein ERS140239_00366 [Staphylococcus schweitzeri]